MTAAPIAAGVPTAIQWTTEFHVFFPDSNGLLWDAWYDDRNGTWNLESLPPGESSPEAGAIGPVRAVIRDGRLHLAYRDGRGALWVAQQDPENRRWALTKVNLDGATNAPAAAGRPAAIEFDQRLHVVYADGRGRIWDAHDSASNGAWTAIELEPQEATPDPALGDPSAILVGEVLQIRFHDTRGVLWDYRALRGTGAWTQQQLNLGGKGSGPAVTGNPVAVQTAWGETRVTYRDAQGALWLVQSL